VPQIGDEIHGSLIGFLLSDQKVLSTHISKFAFPKMFIKFLQYMSKVEFVLGNTTLNARISIGLYCWQECESVIKFNAITPQKM